MQTLLFKLLKNNNIAESHLFISSKIWVIYFIYIGFKLFILNKTK